MDEKTTEFVATFDDGNVLIWKDALGNYAVQFTFNREEAKGSVIVSQHSFGVGLGLVDVEAHKTDYIASLDLFHPACGDGGPMLCIDTPGDDSLGIVRYENGRRILSIEPGVVKMSHDKDGQLIIEERDEE